MIYHTAGLWLWLLTTCSLTATHPFCAGWISEQKETLSWILTVKIKLFWTKWVDIKHPALLKHTQVTWLLQMLFEVHWISDQHKINIRSTMKSSMTTGGQDLEFALSQRPEVCYAAIHQKTRVLSCLKGILPVKFKCRERLNPEPFHPWTPKFSKHCSLSHQKE